LQTQSVSFMVDPGNPIFSITTTWSTPTLRAAHLYLMRFEIGVMADHDPSPRPLDDGLAPQWLTDIARDISSVKISVIPN